MIFLFFTVIGGTSEIIGRWKGEIKERRRVEEIVREGEINTTWKVKERRRREVENWIGERTRALTLRRWVK